MLEEHDRRAFAIAEQAPFARYIPIYPELPPDKSQVNHTAQAIPHSRSPQRITPVYHELLGERHKVQKDLNMGLHKGAQVGVEVPSILRRKEAAPHVDWSLFPELRNGVRSCCQPIEHPEVVCPPGPARDVWLPPHFMHEPPAPLVMPVPVPVPIIEKVCHSFSICYLSLFTLLNHAVSILY
jgi:hypothetical protein